MKLFIIKIKYALKMFTKPLGTKFEIGNKQVNRFVYTFETLKMLNE